MKNIYFTGGRPGLTGAARALIFLLAFSLMSCEVDRRKVQQFKLAVIVGRNLGFKANAPLDSGLKSVLSYYDESACSTDLFVPAVSVKRLDFDPVKAVDVPLFLTSSAKWKVKLGLPLTAYSLKESYDSEMPNLPAFEVLTVQSKREVDSDSVRSQFPEAQELMVKDGLTTDQEAVKRVRAAIGAGLCDGKRAFILTLAPQPEVAASPEPPSTVPVLKPSPVPAPPVVKPPVAKPTAPKEVIAKPLPAVVKATTPPVKHLTPVTKATPLPAPPTIVRETPPKSEPPVPIASKPCFTVQVFSIYKERLEDNPIPYDATFALDDPEKGLLAKGSLSAKVKPCAPIPPSKEVRLRWTRDGVDQANPPLRPREVDGSIARELQNHPLPGKYEVRVLVDGIEATAVPFRFTITPRGAKPSSGSETPRELRQ